MSSSRPSNTCSLNVIQENASKLCSNEFDIGNVVVNKMKVAVAMSGGVDSSVTALLLKQMGYEVVGVTGWLVKSGSRCCDTAMVDAAKVCEQIGIEHHVVDLLLSFKTRVMDEFPKSYAAGRTPLPCSLCNTEIKWGSLYNYATKVLGANYLATGHYAKIMDNNGQLVLAKGIDLTKDQSYVLWGITQEQLAHTLLPLGDYTKDEIRKIAIDNHLETANRPESQDLCFIPKGQTIKDYLANHIPVNVGDIIHIQSKAKLGSHDGFHNFTIGQRKGLNIAFNEPLYVVRLDSVTNTVYVGSKADLLQKELTASECNWLIDMNTAISFTGMAKIRYNANSQLANIFPLPDNKVRVEFDTPQPAITSGQVLAVYDLNDKNLILGGWID